MESIRNFLLTYESSIFIGGFVIMPVLLSILFKAILSFAYKKKNEVIKSEVHSS